MLEKVIGDNVYLEGAKKLVQNFRDQCSPCSKTSLPKSKHVVQHPIVATAPLEHVQIDCVELCKDEDEMKYLTNQIDVFSKFLHSVGPFLLNYRFASNLNVNDVTICSDLEQRGSASCSGLQRFEQCRRAIFRAIPEKNPI